jgi:hypothetical protein
MGCTTGKLARYLEAVASHPSPGVMLTPLGGDARQLSQWLTTFHFAAVVVDPYTNESSWVLKAASRILDALRGSHARVSFVVTAGPDEARAFLGPLSDEFLVFSDADRAFVRSLGLSSLPAFVFVRTDGTLQASAEGWQPSEWRTVAEAIAEATAWIAPTIPVDGEPGAFRGTPAA